MADTTKIEWTDHSASPWHGCQEVHEGCDNCYARVMAARNPGTLGVWGPNGTRVKSKSFIGNLRKWNKQAQAAGKVASVFPSICDPFEDRPELVPWRQEMFDVADECPWIRLLLLTKRPENVRRMWPVKPDRFGIADATPEAWHRRNCWIGTSISNQETADRMLPELLKLRDLTPCLFVSAEPLLGPVRLQGVRIAEAALREKLGQPVYYGPRQIDWLIIGGESGPHARPCDVSWIRSLVKQCHVAGVAAFVKQMGSKPFEERATDLHLPARARELARKYGIGPLVTEVTEYRLRDSKGGDMDEFPDDLKVRQFPQGGSA